MALRINGEAPNFTAETTQGKIDFHEWIGDGWAILFSHPKDFTPVCTTELGYMAGLKPEFDKRNIKIIGLSVDPVADHERWAKDIEETQGHARQLPDDRRPRAPGREGLRHAAGGSGTTSQGRTRRRQRHGALGVRHRAGQEGQGDAHLPDEHRPQLRRGAAAPDSCQLTAKHKVATPVNWKQGQDVIIVPAGLRRVRPPARRPLQGWRSPTALGLRDDPQVKVSATSSPADTSSWPRRRTPPGR